MPSPYFTVQVLSDLYTKLDLIKCKRGLSTVISFLSFSSSSEVWKILTGCKQRTMSGFSENSGTFYVPYEGWVYLPINKYQFLKKLLTVNYFG
jgi:hypothetical protein